MIAYSIVSLAVLPWAWYIASEYLRIQTVHLMLRYTLWNTFDLLLSSSWRLDKICFSTAATHSSRSCYNVTISSTVNCQLVTYIRVRQMRSADTWTLAVNWTSSSFRDRTFTDAGTRVWNSLPPDPRQPVLSYGLFRRSLKTFFIWTVRPRSSVNS